MTGRRVTAWTQETVGIVQYEDFVRMAQQFKQAFERAHNGQAGTIFQGAEISAVKNRTPDKTEIFATVCFDCEKLSDLTKLIWSNLPLVRMVLHLEGNDGVFAAMDFDSASNPHVLEFMVCPENDALKQFMAVPHP
jgi:hypothetical protein